MSGINQDTATRAEELIHRVEVYTQAIKVCMDELKMLIGRKYIAPQRDVKIVEVGACASATSAQVPASIH